MRGWIVLFSLCFISQASAIELKWYDWAQAGISGAGLTTTLFFIDSPQKAKWTGGILLDDSVRNSLRYLSSENRETADTVSDYLQVALIAAPCVQTLFMKDRWTRTMVVANAFMTSGFLNTATKKTVARERPYVRACKEKLAIKDECTSESQNESFYSGHSVLTFTGAGLVCAKKVDGWCATSLGMATAVGYLRMAADKHYLSDVIVGLMLGLATGYVLPKVEHNDFDKGEFEVSLSFPF